MSIPTLRPTLALAAPALALVLALCGCGRSAPAPPGSQGPGRPVFRVVAAESFWGSLAAELAGRRAEVRSLIAAPGVDPHSYQPTAADARLVTDANMVIENGLGYDPWIGQLTRASQSRARRILDVGSLLRLPAGANPHRWYFPADVEAVVRGVVADYDRLDPAGSAYYAERERRLLRVGFAGYDRLRREIRARFAGTAVGYSESIFEGLGRDLGLELATPYGFARAVAEGTDVTAAEKQAVDTLVSRRGIRVWVFNIQNVTPDVQRVNELARAAGVPVVTVTETLSPAGETFEGWQVHQLEGLLRALEAGPR